MIISLSCVINPPPAAPRQAIMPDRSLTYSRAGAPPVPSQPAWFHRLDEILALLRGFDTRYLDRKAVERLLKGTRARSPRQPWRTWSGTRSKRPHARSDLFERRSPAHERAKPAYLNGAGVKALVRGWPYASCSRLLLIQVPSPGGHPSVRQLGRRGAFAKAASVTDKGHHTQKYSGHASTIS